MKCPWGDLLHHQLLVQDRLLGRFSLGISLPNVFLVFLSSGSISIFRATYFVIYMPTVFTPLTFIVMISTSSSHPSQLFL